MDNSQYLVLSEELHLLTPVLVEDTFSYMKENQTLVEHFGHRLRDIAIEAVTSFRDLLLGVLQLDASQLLDNQLGWLNNLLVARKINSINIKTFLEKHRTRYASDLSAELNSLLLPILDAQIARFENSPTV